MGRRWTQQITFARLQAHRSFSWAPILCTAPPAHCSLSHQALCSLPLPVDGPPHGNLAMLTC